MKTIPVIINTCFGGFSLSDQAMLRYAELKGLKLYPEPSPVAPAILPPTYWLVPPEKRVKDLPDRWASHPIEVRLEHNRLWSEQTLSNREIDRTDPIWVQVVQELGPAANGQFAALAIVEIPEDIEWEITEYDGCEKVEEVHRSWS